MFDHQGELVGLAVIFENVDLAPFRVAVALVAMYALYALYKFLYEDLPADPRILNSVREVL